MAVRTTLQQNTVGQKKQPSDTKPETTSKSCDEKADKPASSFVMEEHLPPLPLTIAVFCCSSLLMTLGTRDVLATGKIVGGSLDEAMLTFTRSTAFFNDSLGWKGANGGLSLIQSVSTDANNMGGLFVRKVGGAAAMAVHFHKLLPFFFHPNGANWKAGHFHPLLYMAVLGNLAISCFYWVYLEDLSAAAAGGFVYFIIGLCTVESIVILSYLWQTKPKPSGVSIKMPEGKTPESVPSRVMSRTVFIITTAMTIFALRDLFFPGVIIDLVPRDDIFLEWTNAFLHSPPDGSEEAIQHGLEAPLHIGDKFVSQLMALHILILSGYKYLSAFGIKFGVDGSGEIKCRMIWKAAFFGDVSMLFLMRLFTMAAASASFDMRWHLMCLAYEAFLLGLYAWF